MNIFLLHIKSICNEDNVTIYGKCCVFSHRLSPEVFLKRPATDNHWRLDEILKHKAVKTLSLCLVMLFYTV